MNKKLIFNQLDNIQQKYEYIYKNLVIHKKLYSDHILNCYLLKKSINDIIFQLQQIQIYDQDDFIRLSLLKANFIFQSIKNLEDYTNEIIKENQYNNVGIITFFNILYIPLSLIFCFFGMNLMQRFHIHPIGILSVSIIVLICVLIIIRNDNIKSQINHFLYGEKEKSNLKFKSLI